MLLDSNILIYGAKGPHSRLDAVLDRTDLAATSVTRIETAFDRMRMLPLDDLVAARAIALRQERKMGLADAIIAATAQVYQMPLVTRNTGDFRQVLGLQLIDPFTP